MYALQYIFRTSAITVILFATFLYVYNFSLGRPEQAALFPMMIGLIGMGLTGAQFIKEMVKSIAHLKAIRDGETPEEKPEKDAAGAVDFEMSEEEESLKGRIAAAEQFGWLGALLAGLYILGFYITIPGIIALYMARYRESWLMVIGAAVVSWFVVWAVFDNVLNLPFPRGLIFGWIS